MTFAGRKLSRHSLTTSDTNTWFLISGLETSFRPFRRLHMSDI